MRFLRIGLLLSVVATTGVSAAPNDPWLAIEGGAAFLRADPVQAYGVYSGSTFFDRLLNVHPGSYGRLEVVQFPRGGAIGPFGGFGVVVQGWQGTASVAETAAGGTLLAADTGVVCFGCSDLESTLSRSYHEVSPQLFNRLSPAAMVGVEPFVGLARESVVSSMDTSLRRTSDINATAVGVVLSLQRAADLGVTGECISGLPLAAT